MIAFLNGKFIPEEQALISVFDRGFLYGDGLFETVLIRNRRPFRWQQHFNRLSKGADYLGIRLPFEAAEALEILGQLLARNEMADGLLRLTLSRGVGPRGYSAKNAGPPTAVMTLHASTNLESADPRWRVLTSRLRLPADEPLARFKTANKLLQILARTEADAADVDEALLLNTAGNVVEGASSNIFCIEQGIVSTPPLAGGALPGVTRAVVLELCAELGWSPFEREISLERLVKADAVFFTLTSIGIAEGVALDGKPLRRSPATAQLRRAYLDVLARETQPGTVAR